MQKQTRLGLIRRDACSIHPSHDLIIRGLRWQFNREVTQTYGILRRWRSTASLPGVESEMMVISACGDERRLESFCHTHDIESDHAVIKIHGLIHITDV